MKKQKLSDIFQTLQERYSQWLRYWNVDTVEIIHKKPSNLTLGWPSDNGNTEFITIKPLANGKISVHHLEYIERIDRTCSLGKAETFATIEEFMEEEYGEEPSTKKSSYSPKRTNFRS